MPHRALRLLLLLLSALGLGAAAWRWVREASPSWRHVVLLGVIAAGAAVLALLRRLPAEIRAWGALALAVACLWVEPFALLARPSFPWVHGSVGAGLGASAVFLSAGLALQAALLPVAVARRRVSPAQGRPSTLRRTRWLARFVTVVAAVPVLLPLLLPSAWRLEDLREGASDARMVPVWVEGRVEPRVWTWSVVPGSPLPLIPKVLQSERNLGAIAWGMHQSGAGPSPVRDALWHLQGGITAGVLGLKALVAPLSVLAALGALAGRMGGARVAWGGALLLASPLLVPPLFDLGALAVMVLAGLPDLGSHGLQASLAASCALVAALLPLLAGAALTHPSSGSP